MTLVEAVSYAFVSLLSDALYDTDPIPLLPWLIAAVYDGGYDLFITAIILAFLTDPAQEPDARCVADAVRSLAIP